MCQIHQKKFVELLNLIKIITLTFSNTLKINKLMYENICVHNLNLTWDKFIHL